jgi:GAF domain/PilZ domain
MESTHQTLAFLADRAQYIAGATGAAIALSEGQNVVCRARSGVTAPPVGVSLQTNSSITAECLRTGEILHCRNVEMDERVDVESCRELGIESILLLPLRRFGRVAGVFELFSTQPYAFDEPHFDALRRVGQMAEKALQGSLRWYDRNDTVRALPLARVKKKRRFPRYEMGVPVTIKTLSSGVPQSIPGRSKNLGEGGLAAVVAAELPLKEVVVVEFSLPLMRQTLSFRAAVRTQDRLFHGLEFLTPRLEEKPNFTA